MNIHTKTNTYNRNKKIFKKKNLIKNTSDAPNDVLRQLYEQCILSGDVENKCSINLLHNYLN